MKQPIKTPKVEPGLPKGKPCNEAEARKGSQNAHHNGSSSHGK